MKASDMRVCFLGGGNMASAMIAGATATGIPPADIRAIDPWPEARANLAKRYGIATASEPGPECKGFDLYVLAVKPQQVESALAAFAPWVATDASWLSIVAGTRIPTLQRILGPQSAIIRAMPNTPATIQRGVTGVFAAPTIAPDARARAETLLSTLGAVVWVADEPLLDAVTAVSGSGPAYVFFLIEALEQAGIELGLPSADARTLALQTFVGAAALAASADVDPATLRERVTSKGGTTAAALEHMRATGLAGHWIDSVKQAAKRARELGDATA
jgi:pyrroline-5-carboxylate reductase